MLDEKYYLFTDNEKEKFAKVANYLLAHSFITREIYETKDRMGKINADYRFIEKYYEIFEEFLSMVGYDLDLNDIYGVISIKNRYNHNLVRFDKFTTLLMLTLRMMYDDGRSQSASSSNNVVYTTIGNVVHKMFDLKIISKKPTLKDLGEGFRNLARYNVLCKLDKTYEDANATIVILPTVIEVVSNEKINAIFNMVFDDSPVTSTEETAAEN